MSMIHENIVTVGYNKRKQKGRWNPMMRYKFDLENN